MIYDDFNLVMLNRLDPFDNSVDPGQLASIEAVWSESTLFSTIIDSEDTCL